MKKFIKKIGRACVIAFTPENLKEYGLEEGDLIHLTITKIEHPEKKKKVKKQ